MTREEAEDLSEEDKGEEEKTAEGPVSPWPRLAFTREKRNKRNWVGRIDMKDLVVSPPTSVDAVGQKCQEGHSSELCPC
jgi:hypothetical protein